MNMALVRQLQHQPLPVLPFILLFALLPTFSQCFHPKLLNISMRQLFDLQWDPAGATWYGDSTGAGSTGGACGYGSAVAQPPFSAMVSAGGPSLFLSGEGCGACYEVKCTGDVACSGNPVTVTITDSCPGCPTEEVHFDLSGTAFGAMAKPGLDQQLRDVGVLQIQHRRVECNYPGATMTIRIDEGANPYYFAAAFEYADADGTLKTVELQQQGNGEWLAMQESWGVVWELNSGSLLNPPFSIRLTEADSGQSLILSDVIPTGWQPGQTYRSLVNFKVT
ncbi:expansin [Ancistrocladus abbreviatus]